MAVATYIFSFNKSLTTKSGNIKITSQKIDETKLRKTKIDTAATAICPSIKITTVRRMHGSPTDALFIDKFDDAVNEMKEIITGFNLRKDGDRVEGLIMIDMIQRSSVEYYFESEIKDVLERHFNKWYVMGQGGDDLSQVSLGFRLLRQQGYVVIANDIFAKLKNDNGNFKPQLCKDIVGLVNLFEASQLSFHGDDILDEASEFSRNILEYYSKNAHHLEMKITQNTLDNPYQRSLPRFTSLRFLPDFQCYLKFHDINASNRWTNILQNVAIMDFNMAQILQQNEITQVSRWWKQLNHVEELKLVRDNPVKWYMWSLAALPNLRMGEERIQFTKQVSYIYLMDDIFDLYGTIDELILFNEAIDRWDYGDQRLPKYMKMFLRSFYEIIDEISYNIYVKHGSNPKKSIRKVWVDLCNAYLIESKWFAAGHSPKSEEYLKNGIVTSGTYVAAVVLFYLIGEGINNNDIIFSSNFQALVANTAILHRLWDDLASGKGEHQDENDVSFIDCYMKEHEGTSFEGARNVISKLVLDAWKSLNQECMSSSPYPTLKKSLHNLAKMFPTMYSYNDDQHLPLLEEYMKPFIHDQV